jgi:hypothetical protein
LLRFQASEALRARGIHEFDAWASAFGDTRTELELQPSGAYKPVERFSEFVNVPELIDIFRSVADVVQKADLRRYLKLPALKGGQRQLITAPASEAFRDYQRILAERITAIEQRTPRGQLQSARRRRHPDRRALLHPGRGRAARQLPQCARGCHGCVRRLHALCSSLASPLSITIGAPGCA